MSEAQAAAQASLQLRGWSLDGAAVVEVAAADGAPIFFVHCAGRWVRCRNLEASIDVIWDQLRVRAQLPPQWGMPAHGVLEDFHEHWHELRRLSPGQWWPAAPQPPPPHDAVDAAD